MSSFGVEISGNRRRNAELSVQQRDLIIAKCEAGASSRELAEEFNCTRRCINKTLQRYGEQHHNQSRPRSGRPQALNTHDKRVLYREARKNPRIEYPALLREASLRRISRTTAYRALKAEGLTNFRAARKPKITRAVAQERRQFEREYRNWDWRGQPFRFSDECSIQRRSGGTSTWVFRLPHEKWRHEMIEETVISRSRAAMVWASIWLDRRGRVRRSPLVIMPRDPAARRKGYSAWSYIEALREGLLCNYHAGDIYMHDNAPIHRARQSLDFLAEHGIQPIEWPRYSPDINPIEHLWWSLKRELHKRYPNMGDLGDGDEDFETFCAALKDCWRRIPDSLIRKLILSMPRRLLALRRARGYQTKY